MGVNRKIERAKAKQDKTKAVIKEFNIIKADCAKGLRDASSYATNIDQLIITIGDLESTDELKGMLTAINSEKSDLEQVIATFPATDLLLSNSETFHDGEVDVVDAGLTAGKTNMNIQTIILEFISLMNSKLEPTNGE